MTDEQIKKALEDYKNSKILQTENGVISIGDILDLINRKDAKVELLTMDVNSLTSERDALQEMVKEQKAEIEQLERNFRAAKVDAKLKTSEIERLQEVTTNTVNSSIRFGLDKEQEIRKAKSEAYKEFAERLKAKATSTFYEERKYVDTEDIDEVLEELTEGGNEDGMD